MISVRISLRSQVLRLAIVVGAVCLTIGAASGVPAYSTRQQLSAQAIADFKSNPNGLLNENPTGGGQLIARIRDLLASDPATLPIILGLVTSANKDQKPAMGAALAQAARLYIRVDQAFAAQIQQAVADTKDQALIVAYAAAAGNLPIGGLGGGAAGSGGSSGGQTGALSGPTGFGGAIQGINGGSVDTGNFSASGSASSAAGLFNSSTTTNGTSSSVSP
jgi:hypothetical protein